MNTKYDSWLLGVSRFKIATPAMPPATRLVLPVLVALVAVMSLMSRLSVARDWAQAGPVSVMTASLGKSACALSIAANGVPTRCRSPVPGVTKHIDPTDPDTGDVVTITFVITGLGVKQVDVVLVQDVSGSMNRDGTPSGQTRLGIAQAAAITFVNGLTDTDRVAVVAYSNTTQLTPALPLTRETDVAIAVIQSLEARENWYTNIGDGIQAGYKELITSTRYASKTVKAMVLLSDGQANRPTDDPEGHARSWARAAGECGILIYTIGLGSDVSENLMQDIAAFSGGEYYYSPDGTDLGTIYQEIALELRNLVITDVLPAGVDLDCDLLSSDWQCIKNDGTTTIVIPISNRELVTDPLTVFFTATVNLDPRSEGPINVEGSKICYDGPVITPCQDFVNPPITVGGRKITGTVFEDLDQDGYFDGDESAFPGVVVTTSNGLVSETNGSGVYVFRTLAGPTITIAISIPPNYIATTSAITHIPPFSGTYRRDFGLYTGLVGEKYSRDINGPPLFEEDELAYTITVHNISTSPRPNVLITDPLPMYTSINGLAHITPSGSGTVTVAGRILTGVVGSLLPGEAVTVTFLVTVDRGTSGQTISNCAYVTSTGQFHRLSLSDEKGPVEAPRVPNLSKVPSAQVVRLGTEITYTYTVSNPGTAFALTNIVVEDSHLGPVSPTCFNLPPNQSAKVIATTTLTQNTTNIATVTCEVEGYSGQVEGNPVTATVHVIEGISLTQVYTEPPPVYHGDITTLYYSIVNQDVDDDVVSATMRIIDSLGRTLGETRFDRLSPSATISQSSSPFSVPHDIVITLTTTAIDDIQGTLLLSDLVTLPSLCPQDVYERDFVDDYRNLLIPEISPSDDSPQLHNLSGNEDWVALRVYPGDQSIYTFAARPLAPRSVPISLTLHHGHVSLASSNNLGNPRSAVLIRRILLCGEGSAFCQYYLQIQSPESGCGTEYELWVEKTPLWSIWLPTVLRNW